MFNGLINSKELLIESGIFILGVVKFFRKELQGRSDAVDSLSRAPVAVSLAPVVMKSLSSRWGWAIATARANRSLGEEEDMALAQGIGQVLEVCLPVRTLVRGS